MGARLEVRFSATADLYALLRHLATAAPDAAGEWADTVGRARTVFAPVSGPRAPLLVDPAVASFDGGPAALAADAHRFPEDIDGIPVRAFVEQVSALMADEEGRYAELSAGRRRAVAERAMATIAALIGPVEQACLDDLCALFAFGGADLTIPVLVVASGVALGGMTNADLDGRPVCLVAAQDLEGSLLAEIVLHEATHALGVSAQADDSPFARLWDVSHAAVEAGRRDLMQVWHVPYFATAAHVVRRRIDPDHAPYGECRGYYARAGRAAELVLPPWLAYLDGSTTLEAAVEAIEAAVEAEVQAAPA